MSWTSERPESNQSGLLVPTYVRQPEDCRDTGANLGSPPRVGLRKASVRAGRTLQGLDRASPTARAGARAIAGRSWARCQRPLHSSTGSDHGRSPSEACRTRTPPKLMLSSGWPGTPGWQTPPDRGRSRSSRCSAPAGEKYLMNIRSATVGPSSWPDAHGRGPHEGSNSKARVRVIWLSSSPSAPIT